MDELLAAPIGAVLIFFLRILDVSMAMIRMLLAVRGHRGKAAFIGFFEVSIWLFAVGSTLNHLSSPFHFLAYAGGFATGNYVGVALEARFALGTSVVRAVFRGEPHGEGGSEAALLLREAGYAVTELPGRGKDGDVDILNVVVQRKRVPDVLKAIRQKDPNAFITVEEVRTAHGGRLSAPYVRPGGRKMPFLTRM